MRGRGSLTAMVFFNKGNFFFLANDNSRKFKQNQIMFLIPVSYTHLDVYKRQFIRGVTDRIARLLSRHGVRTMYTPTRKVQQFLRPVKNARDPLTSCGVYVCPVRVAQVYVGTTKRRVWTRVGERSRCCRLREPEKSAVAEHALYNTNHRVLFEETGPVFCPQQLSSPAQTVGCLLYTSRCV